MPTSRDRAGFSLVEMLTVLAIIGIVSALAVPNLLRWQLREDTRSHAGKIARVLSLARATAMRRGAPTFVLFNGPGIPQSAAGEFAMIVEDNDGDFLIGPTDNWTNFQKDDGIAQEVVGYGMGGGTPMEPGAPLAPEDNAAGNLGALAGASTFPVAPPPFGVPAVGFTAQGIPVDMNTPTQWGSGAGAYYVTDDSTSVYAVVVLPLGGIRVRSLVPGQNIWR